MQYKTTQQHNTTHKTRENTKQHKRTKHSTTQHNTRPDMTRSSRLQLQSQEKTRQ
jgi:hypothetical protein